MALAVEFTPESCFHCGLEVPAGLQLATEVLGASRPMCCVGCLAVAEMLVAQGLSGWYERRAAPSGVPASPVPEVLEKASFLALEDADYDVSEREGVHEVSLLVGEMSCPACAWIIERHVGGLEGVRRVRANLVSGRVRVLFSDGRVGLAEIVSRLAEIGFTAWADRADRAAERIRGERRQALVRLGIAGLATMNVMTYAVALYAGAIDGMPASVQQLLRVLCALVATPVVAISARPFFEGALRDLRIRRAGMDVPVALAIGGAYAASVWAVITGEGEVYFESVCMFTFFLGAGRFLELNVRHRSAALAQRLRDANPLVARRLDEAGEELVDLSRIVPGDRLSIHPGDVVPVDGRIVEGETAIEEAVLTGEPWPRRVGQGAPLRAGSVNAESPFVLEAERKASDSTLAAMVRMIEGAQSERPALARKADRLASVFVVFVLGIAAVTAVFWSLHDSERALWIVLSVLVATCPCALGLATPAALAAATEGLAREGFLIARSHVLELLPRLDRIFFDKTGTLTRGEPCLASTRPVAGWDAEEALMFAQALERDSEHVLAKAFATERAGTRALPVDQKRNVPGCGIEGRIQGEIFRIGRPEWAIEIAADPEVPPAPEDDALSFVMLANERGAVAWFGVGDRVRSEAAATIDRLARKSIRLELLSGDPSPAARCLAAKLRLGRGVPAASPGEKLDRIRSAHAAGEVVAVVGDGLNDGPVMRAADVSVAMGSGCDLTRLHADAILPHDDLEQLPRAIDHARRTARVIAQNFAWAIGYNLVVLPLAVTGHLAPWLAALGMSLSSLVVALNATRLRHVGRAR